MNIGELLVDAFDRLREPAHAAADGLDEDALAWRPDTDANSVSWLLWHLARVQDDHVADAFGDDQVWAAGGWAERFALPFDVAETGYGHSAEAVGGARVSAELLTGYLDAVLDRTIQHLGGVSQSDLDRVVDERWDPPVTLGVRLVSVLSDDLQHLGQASYVRGLLDRT